MVSDLRNKIQDFMITVILWGYYILGFLFFFSFFYLQALFTAADTEEAFQKLNHRLHRSFFTLLRFLVPKTRWRISEEVSAIRSSLIIANHLSFLDPIWFVSLYERQKTLIHSGYFRLPVFGWILRRSGYIPSVGGGLFTADMAAQIKGLRDYLAQGGNLFIFPEWTRSRDGRLAPFEQGAFKIARLCRAAPIQVLAIRNTHRLFPPDRFLFNTHEENVITVELAGTLTPDYGSETFSLAALMAEARELMERQVAL